MFWPEQAATRREANASRVWMATVDRNEAPRTARTWTDNRRRNGGDDEGGEDAPSRAATLGAGRSRAPERYRRDDTTPRRR